MMPTSVGGILKVAPMSLNRAIGIYSVVLKMKAPTAKAMTLNHCLFVFADIGVSLFIFFFNILTNL
jgi:hypothetical protein